MKKAVFLLHIFYAVSLVAQKNDISIKPIEMKGINFQNLSFEELKAKAKKEKKTIFMNVYMTNCMPCKEMERNVFTDISVADYYNPGFINASVDYNGGEGQLISEQYGINCAPTYLFIDSTGEIVHRSHGYKSQEELLELAKEAKDPKRNLAYFEREYPQKRTDSEFLLRYLYVLDKASCFRLGGYFFPTEPGKELWLRMDTVFNAYFAAQKEDSLINKTNWEAIRDFTYDYKSRDFKYLLKNAAEYKKRYSEEAVNEKIKDVIISGNALYMQGKGFTEANSIAYINEVKAISSPEIETAVFWLRLNNADTDSKWEEYMRLVNESGSKYILSPREKEYVSKAIYENITDKASLQKAEQMMESALVESPSWLVYETYANVLLKLNKKEQAKANALKALEIAKQIGAKKENYNSITYLLEQIEEQ